MKVEISPRKMPMGRCNSVTRAAPCPVLALGHSSGCLNPKDPRATLKVSLHPILAPLRPYACFLPSHQRLWLPDW